MIIILATPVLFFALSWGMLGADHVGLINKVYNLWDRNPITVRSSYLASGGRTNAPPATKLPSY